jgi:predicted RNase H-like HicB family nuclease
MSEKYLVVIEQADDGSYSAYLPDLPGCVSCGDSREEVETMIQEALDFHLEGMRRAGLAVPPPRTVSAYVASAVS